MDCKIKMKSKLYRSKGEKQVTLRCNKTIMFQLTDKILKENMTSIYQDFQKVKMWDIGKL